MDCRPRAAVREAPVQPFGRDADRVEVAVQVVRVQRSDDELTLAPPRLALDREHAGEADFREAVLDLPPTPEALGAFAQHTIDLLGVAEDDDQSWADAELEERPVAIGPLLDDDVRASHGNGLVETADQGQPARAGQVTNRARRSCRALRAHRSLLSISPRASHPTASPLSALRPRTAPGLWDRPAWMRSRLRSSSLSATNSRSSVIPSSLHVVHLSDSPCRFGTRYQNAHEAVSAFATPHGISDDSQLSTGKHRPPGQSSARCRVTDFRRYFGLLSVFRARGFGRRPERRLRSGTSV